MISPQATSLFDAVVFDLLTALIDSWSLWIEVAGQEDLGRRWRRASLRVVTTAGAYRPYEAIVREAAHEVGLAPATADRLIARWIEGCQSALERDPGPAPNRDPSFGSSR
jgi:hypothetical protein